MIIAELLAGVAKTLVVSMLSERLVLRVFVMFAEWRRQTHPHPSTTRLSPKSAQSMKRMGNSNAVRFI